MKIKAVKKLGFGWKKYVIEFISVFTAVLFAFVLNNWSDNRKDRNAESKILSEISHGLRKDSKDIKVNTHGHMVGLAACNYWRRVINNEQFDEDSLQTYYFGLTRDYISIQNISGYETLKSKGLEIIKNDSLRFEIISLYEYDFNTLRKFEEEYNEMQFQSNYFNDINNIIAPFLNFNKLGNIESINLPIELKNSHKNLLFSYLLKIKNNREFILSYYSEIDIKVRNLITNIDKELGK